MFAEFLNLFQSHHVGQLQVSKEGFFLGGHPKKYSQANTIGSHGLGDMTMMV